MKGNGRKDEEKAWKKVGKKVGKKNVLIRSANVKAPMKPRNVLMRLRQIYLS